MQHVDVQAVTIVGPEQAVSASRRSEGLFAMAPFWGLVGLLAWAPLPFASNRAWSWSLLSLGVGVLLTIWSLAALRQPSLMKLPWRRCAGAGIFFVLACLWAFLQTGGMIPEALHDPVWQQASRLLERPLVGSISSDPLASRDGLMRLIAYAGAFWLAAQYGRNPVHARQFVLSIAIIGAAYAAYGIVVFSTGNKWILWYERWAYTSDLTSTFVSRSAFGAYAGMALLSALALLLGDRDRRVADGRKNIRAAIIAYVDGLPPSFYVLVVVSLVLATALLLTHSRGAVMVTAMGLGVMLTCFALKRGTSRRTLLLTIGLIAIAGIVMLELSGRVTLGRALQLADQGTGREAIHALTRRGISDAPVTGHGLDTFPQLYFQYRDATIPWTSPRYDKAHSTYLELVLELGVIGFALLMAALAVIILRILSGMLRRRRDRVYPVWGLGITVLIATHAVLDFSIQIPAVALAFATILGVAYAQSWPTDQPAEKTV